MKDNVLGEILRNKLKKYSVGEVEGAVTHKLKEIIANWVTTGRKSVKIDEPQVSEKLIGQKKASFLKMKVWNPFKKPKKIENISDLR